MKYGATYLYVCDHKASGVKVNAPISSATATPAYHPPNLLWINSISATQTVEKIMAHKNQKSVKK